MHEIELQCDIRTVQYDILQADSGCNEAVALQDGGLNSGTSVFLNKGSLFSSVGLQYSEHVLLR